MSAPLENIRSWNSLLYSWQFPKMIVPPNCYFSTWVGHPQKSTRRNPKSFIMQGNHCILVTWRGLQTFTDVKFYQKLLIIHSGCTPLLQETYINNSAVFTFGAHAFTWESHTASCHPPPAAGATILVPGSFEHCLSLCWANYIYI